VLTGLIPDAVIAQARPNPAGLSVQAGWAVRGKVEAADALRFAAGAAVTVASAPARQTAGENSPPFGADPPAPWRHAASAAAAWATSTAGAAVSSAEAGHDRPHSYPNTQYAANALAVDASIPSSSSCADEFFQAAPVAADWGRPTSASERGFGAPAARDELDPTLTWAAVAKACFTPPIAAARPAGRPARPHSARAAAVEERLGLPPIRFQRHGKWAVDALTPAAGQRPGSTSPAAQAACDPAGPSRQSPGPASAMPEGTQALTLVRSPVALSHLSPSQPRSDGDGDEDGDGGGWDNRPADFRPGALVRWDGAETAQWPLRGDAHGRWVPGDAGAGRTGGGGGRNCHTGDGRWSAVDRWLEALEEEEGMAAAEMEAEAGLMVLSGRVPNDAARLSLNLRIRFGGDGPLPSFAGCPAWARSFLSIHYQVPQCLLVVPQNRFQVPCIVAQ
jgi:hypothetical protein